MIFSSKSPSPAAAKKSNTSESTSATLQAAVKVSSARAFSIAIFFTAFIFIFVLRARKPKSDGLSRIPKCRADVSPRRPQNRGCQDRVADEWLAREAGWAFPYHFRGNASVAQYEGHRLLIQSAP